MDKISTFKRGLLLLVFFMTGFLIKAQDTLFLPGGTAIYGEVKSMSSGVLKMETSYSDDDFTIEWLDIERIITTTRFLITLQGSQRTDGYLRSSSNGSIEISSDEGNFTTTFDEIVELSSLDESFWSRVTATVDVGLNLTKANNLRQFNARSNVGYKADRWYLGLKYDALNSTQDGADDIERRDFGANFTYYPYRKWYLYSELNWFSNTEQAIDLRFTAKIGAGRSIIQNNKAKWGVLLGYQPVSEQFSDGVTEDNTSGEIFLGTEWNLFDTGDLSFYGSLFAYPSLTEEDPVSGDSRFRTDFNFNIKYDLPLDFYISTGLTLNYDNLAVTGTDTDYVWNFGFGWEL